MFIVDRFLGLVNGSPELVKIFSDRIQQLFYYSFIKIIDTLLKNKLTSMPVYPVFIRSVPRQIEGRFKSFKGLFSHHHPWTQTSSIGFTAKEILVYLQEHCNET